MTLQSFQRIRSGVFDRANSGLRSSLSITTVTLPFTSGIADLESLMPKLPLFSTTTSLLDVS